MSKLSFVSQSSLNSLSKTIPTNTSKASGATCACTDCPQLKTSEQSPAACSRAASALGAVMLTQNFATYSLFLGGNASSSWKRKVSCQMPWQHEYSYFRQLWQNDTCQKGGTDFRLHLPYQRNFLLLEKHHTKNICDSSAKGLGHPRMWRL